MRKRIGLSLILGIILILAMVVPVSAATTENWEFFRANYPSGTVYGYYTINTVNLQVDSFTLVNNTTDRTGRIRVFVGDYDNPTEVLLLFTASPGQTVTMPINNFKFHKLPHTDPLDPDSIRYPNGVVIEGGAG